MDLFLNVKTDIEDLIIDYMATTEPRSERTALIRKKRVKKQLTKIY